MRPATGKRFTPHSFPLQHDDRNLQDQRTQGIAHIWAGVTNLPGSTCAPARSCHLHQISRWPIVGRRAPLTSAPLFRCACQAPRLLFACCQPSPTRHVSCHVLATIMPVAWERVQYGYGNVKCPGRHTSQLVVFERQVISHRSPSCVTTRELVVDFFSFPAPRQPNPTIRYDFFILHSFIGIFQLLATRVCHAVSCASTRTHRPIVVFSARIGIPIGPCP